MQRRIQVWLGSALVIGTAAAPAMAQCPLQTSAEAECVVLEREASSTPMTADLACSPSIQSAVQDFKESWRVRTADRARVDDWLAAPDKHLFGLVTAWQRAASTASSASNDPEASVEGEVRVEVGAGVEDIAALWSGAGPGDEEDIGTLGLNTSVQTAASASDILLAYEGQAAVGGCSAGSGGTGTGGGPGGPLGGGPALTPGGPVLPGGGLGGPGVGSASAWGLVEVDAAGQPDACLCWRPAYAIEGTVEGLTGRMGLELSGTENGEPFVERLSVVGDYTLGDLDIAFATHLLEGDDWQLSVVGQPAHPVQHCEVETAMSGTIAGAPASFVVHCETDTTRPHVRRSENWFSDSQSRVTGAGGFSQGEWYIQAGVEHDLSVSYDNDGSGSIKLDAPYVFPLTGNMQARLQRNPDPGQSFVVGFHMLSDVDLAGVNIWAIFTGTDCDQEEATGTVKALSRKTRAAGREAGVWHEVVVKFVAPRDPRCFEQATKIKLLRLDADYQVPKDGDVWIDNLYAGTFGTVEPPAAKRSFDGGTIRIDGLGNHERYVNGSWEPFFPMCVTPDRNRKEVAGETGMYDFYKQGGFECVVGFSSPILAEPVAEAEMLLQPSLGSSVFYSDEKPLTFGKYGSPIQLLEYEATLLGTTSDTSDDDVLAMYLDTEYYEELDYLTDWVKDGAYFPCHPCNASRFDPGVCNVPADVICEDYPFSTYVAVDGYGNELVNYTQSRFWNWEVIAGEWVASPCTDRPVTECRKSIPEINCDDPSNPYDEDGNVLPPWGGRCMSLFGVDSGDTGQRQHPLVGINGYPGMAYYFQHLQDFSYTYTGRGTSALSSITVADRQPGFEIPFLGLQFNQLRSIQDLRGRVWGGIIGGGKALQIYKDFYSTGEGLETQPWFREDPVTGMSELQVIREELATLMHLIRQPHWLNGWKTEVNRRDVIARGRELDDDGYLMIYNDQNTRESIRISVRGLHYTPSGVAVHYARGNHSLPTLVDLGNGELEVSVDLDGNTPLVLHLLR